MSVVLATLAGTEAVMCAYGDQLLIVIPFVGRVGTYTWKTCQASIGQMILLTQTQKVLDDQRNADVLQSREMRAAIMLDHARIHPSSCKYSQQCAVSCWTDLCNRAQIFLNLFTLVTHQRRYYSTCDRLRPDQLVRYGWPGSCSFDSS